MKGYKGSHFPYSCRRHCGDCVLNVARRARTKKKQKQYRAPTTSLSLDGRNTGWALSSSSPSALPGLVICLAIGPRCRPRDTSAYL
jgi:hypothetical protein